MAETAQLTIIDPCLTFDVTPGAALANQEYFVGTDPLITPVFDEFTITPVYCSTWYYSTRSNMDFAAEITPALTAPDDTAIMFDLIGRQFTIETSNINLVGDYTVRVSYVDPDGVQTTTGWDFVVSIKSPCPDAILTIDPTIVEPTKIDWIAGSIADVQIFEDEKVTSSELPEICPYELEFDLINRDGSAVDILIFSFNEVAKTLYTFTDDVNKLGYYKLTLTVNYAGHPILPTNKLDFDIEIHDPCPHDAILTAVTQTDPAVYNYSGVASFVMAPFAIAPAGFCTAVHSCSMIDGARLDLCDIATANSVGTFNHASGNYEFKSDLVTEVEPGEYTFEITATVGATMSSISFVLTIEDPCVNSDFITFNEPAFLS